MTAVRTDRPPDHAGWFTAPVRVALEATDATSSLAECPTVTYGGPDSAAVSVTGTCRDRAGNTSSHSLGLSFDATAPQLTSLSASGGDGRVMLRWRAAGGAASVERSSARPAWAASLPASCSAVRGAGFADTRRSIVGATHTRSASYSRFETRDDRVTCGCVMFGCVLIRRAITATDVTALGASSQVKPPTALPKHSRQPMPLGSAKGLMPSFSGFMSASSYPVATNE